MASPAPPSLPPLASPSLPFELFHFCTLLSSHVVSAPPRHGTSPPPLHRPAAQRPCGPAALRAELCDEPFTFSAVLALVLVQLPRAALSAATFVFVATDKRKPVARFTPTNNYLQHTFQASSDYSGGRSLRLLPTSAILKVKQRQIRHTFNPSS